MSKKKKKTTSVWVNLCINASCYSTRAYLHRYCSMCIYFFNNFFSPSLSGAQLFLSSSHLINLSSSSFRWSPSLPPPIAFSSFVSRCFWVEWTWSVGFGLNRVECLSPSPPLAFGGVDLVAQGEASIPVWYHFDPFCSRWGVDSGVGFDPFCWVCFSGFLLVGCVDSDVIPVWIVGVGFDPFCWVCFSSFLPVGCVDSNVIPVWIVGVGQWLCG